MQAIAGSAEPLFDKARLGSDRPRWGRQRIGRSILVCLALLQITSAGLIAAGNRGRASEALVIGAGSIVGYLLGWKRAPLTSAAIVAILLALEWAYGRLGHADYWRAVALALGGGGSVLAASYLRFAVESRESHVRREWLDEQQVDDEISLQLGIEARRSDSVAYELERARRHNHSLSLLLVRPDDLAEIELRYGEDAKQATQKAVATSIDACLRATDIPLRAGEDAFGVILPETRAGDARLVAERIRLDVARRRLEFGPGDIVDLTVGIGVASFPNDATSNETLSRAARSALDAAVESGGNRTLLYSVPDDSPSGWGMTSRSSVT